MHKLFLLGPYLYFSGCFPKDFKGVAKGLMLSNILEEARAFDKYLRIFYDYMCFLYEKVQKKIKAQGKKWLPY